MKKFIIFGLMLLLCLSIVFGAFNEGSNNLLDSDIVEGADFESVVDRGLGSDAEACEHNLDCDDGYVCVRDVCIAYCIEVEFTQCNDELDNDGDGLIDYPKDTDCVSPLDVNESSDTNNFGISRAAGQEQGFFAKVWDLLIFWN